MNNLSLPTRIVLGIAGIIAVLIIAAIGYYLYLGSSRGKAIEVDQYPGTRLVNEETLGEGWDHLQYSATADDPVAYAQGAARFYADAGYECTTFSGRVMVDGAVQENIYIRSRCFLDRSHPLGFNQTVDITIQPERVLEGEIDGSTTGTIIIDVQRRWDSYNAIGD